MRVYLVSNMNSYVERLKEVYGDRKLAYARVKKVKNLYAKNGWEIVESKSTWFSARKCGLVDYVVIESFEVQF